MHLPTEFEIPTSIRLLVITIKLKDIVQIVFCFKFYQKNILKLHIYQRSVKTKISELLPTVEVVAAAILVLLMSGY
jgi:hypothetical protein